MDIILTDAQCNQLEQMNGDLRRFPGMIQQIGTGFQQLLRAPVMAAWIAGTVAAQSAEAELTRNIRGSEQVAERIQQIIRANEAIINWNRENNRKTIR